jgi:hypothetical protein
VVRLYLVFCRFGSSGLALEGGVSRDVELLERSLLRSGELCWWCRRRRGGRDGGVASERAAGCDHGGGGGGGVGVSGGKKRGKEEREGIV